MNSYWFGSWFQHRSFLISRSLLKWISRTVHRYMHAYMNTWIHTWMNTPGHNGMCVEGWLIIVWTCFWCIYLLCAPILNIGFIYVISFQLNTRNSLPPLSAERRTCTSMQRPGDEVCAKKCQHGFWDWDKKTRHGEVTWNLDICIYLYSIFFPCLKRTLWRFWWQCIGHDVVPSVLYLPAS